MNAFDYHAPQSLTEMDALLNQSDAPSRCFLAGGTDLIVQLQAGVKAPQQVIDIKHLAECQTLGITHPTIRIGAAISSAEVTRHSEICRLYPGYTEAMELIGSTQVQSRATPVGNLCNASPAADSVPALLAANGNCVIYSPSGSRTVPAASICTGPGKTILESDEFITEIQLPVPAKGNADAYQRFTPRNEMDIAVVGLAVNLTLDENSICTQASIVVGAVAPTAVICDQAAQLLVGTSLDDATLAAAANCIKENIHPISDKRGTQEFRTQIAGVLLTRVVQSAASRAKANLQASGTSS